MRSIRRMLIKSGISVSALKSENIAVGYVKYYYQFNDYYNHNRKKIRDMMYCKKTYLTVVLVKNTPVVDQLSLNY